MDLSLNSLNTRAPGESKHTPSSENLGYGHIGQWTVKEEEGTSCGDSTKSSDSGRASFVQPDSAEGFPPGICTQQAGSG